MKQLTLMLVGINKPIPMTENKHKEIKEDILKTFHSQFAENQNHHQRLFVQFLSAVLIILVGYAYALINTSADANFFNTIREGNQIVSYGISHFIYSYIIVQFIMALLALLILNIGYSFRRDQLVNYNIRKKYLGMDEYQQLFNSNSFNPKKLGIGDYLPGFNYIIYIFLFLVQIILSISFFYLLNNFKNLPTYFFEYKICFNFIFVFPIILTLIHYFYYYFKYSRRIKNKIKKYKIIFNGENVLIKNKVSNYKSIPLLKTFGKLPYYLKRKESSITFNHNVDDNNIHLIYLLIPKRIKEPFKALKTLINFVTNYAIENNVREVEAIIVNNKISNNILKRNGWIFKKKNWYKGNHFVKRFGNTTANNK